MKKYALLFAIAIAPSLAHDSLENEDKSNLVSKPKLALHTETHHTHSPLVIDQDPLNENDSTEAKIAKRENLETLIDKAEKTIAKLDTIKDDHLSEKYLESSQGNDQSKFSFNKWAGLNQNPDANYISGGSSGTSGGASGGASAGSGGGSSGSPKMPSNGSNPEAHDGGVVATAVPEPEVYLMFLAGLGLIGYRAKKHLSR
jgi:uncharacterized membrane protein YgcG